MAASSSPDAVGLDTSVVLRLMRGEPPAQARRAMQFVSELLAENRRAIVSDLVVAEAYFALHSHYDVPKKEALRALSEFLHSGLVDPEPGGCAPQALVDALTSPTKPGFVDRLIHAQYAKMAGRLVSFERAAAKLEGATVLKA